MLYKLRSFVLGLVSKWCKIVIMKLSFCMGLLVFLLLIEASWPKDFLEREKLGVARWPQSSKAHLKFSQALFKAGYQKEAEKELRIAGKSWRLTTNPYFFLETDKMLREPYEIEEEIQNFEAVLKDKPWYRDVFLNLSLLYDRLYQREKAKEYFDKAFYLDPLNEGVQKVGKTLGFF